MTKAVVGVIGNSYIVENRYAAQLVGQANMLAVAEVADALPLMFAGLRAATCIADLLGAVDGILLTGARANVHPRRYGTAARPGFEPFDEERDAVSLPLIQACIETGTPVFGICRGFQEMNVAFGGSLHPEIRDLPGRMNHRMPRLANGEIHPDLDVIFADRHDVRLVPDGAFARLFGRDLIRVNSLHGQGLDRVGQRVVVEGVAEDGTMEAIRIDDAPAFALGVQWHAEYDPRTNPVNHALFAAFGAAVAARAARGRDRRRRPVAVETQG